MESLEVIAKFLKGYALLIVGLAAIICGANGFSDYRIIISNPIYSWILIVLGIIAFLINIVFGVLDRRKSSIFSHKDFKIDIDSPQVGDTVRSPISVFGRFEKQPPDGLLFAFEFNPNTNSYYPKGEVKFQVEAKRWNVTMHIGNADNKYRNLVIVSVGPNGKFYIDFFNKVVADHNKWVGVKSLPPDSKILKEVKIILLS